MKTTVRQKKTRLRLRPAQKFLLALCGAALLGVLAFQLYQLFHFRLHDDFKALLPEPYTVALGQPFAPLPEDTPDVPGMALAAENDLLKLYVDQKTANVAVYDKRTGAIAYTNPIEAMSDPVAGGVNKSILMSQLIVEYFDANRLPGRYNSYDFSVSLGQFGFESLAYGLRCTYSFGDLASPTGIVPVYISEERLRHFTDLMGADGTGVFMRYLPSTEADGFLQLNDGSRGQATLRRLNASFTEAGYTEEDFVADMSASGVEGAVPLSFTVPLEYRLEDDALVVSIPVREITESGGGKVFRIQMLRSFAAGGGDERGYMVVPNGSGSLIRFNNGKTHAEDYMQYIYGLDPMADTYVTLGNTEPARLPYFGIHREAGGDILAEVESGETLTLLTASIAGKLNSYNYVYPTFVLRGSASLAMFGSTGNEAELPVVEQHITDAYLRVRYSFLTPEYAGYAGMARYVREKLEQSGTFKTKSEAGDVPFYMDLVGSVMGQKFFLGVSYAGQNPMTTYADAHRIVDDLAENGVQNQVVNYQGWFNRGYYHDVASRVQPIRALGSMRELEALSHKLEAQGGRLYADVAFQRVSFFSKRYNWQLETSRYYGGGMVAAFGQVNPVTLYNTSHLGYIEILFNLLSPRFLRRHVDQFNRGFGRYDLGGVSLRDLGDVLHSDRKRTGYINREEAKLVVLDSLNALDEANGRLLISGGNAYAFPFSDELINVPIAHNALYMVDEEIPFYQMLLHGYIPYAGPPINLSDAYDEAALTLRLIEYGASPHFVFTWESSSALKYTGLNRLYSTTYNNWRDTAIRVYQQVNEALGPVSGSIMANHEILPGGLRRVTYESGAQLWINHADSPRRHEGVTVGAKSWLVREGGL